MRSIPLTAACLVTGLTIASSTRADDCVTYEIIDLGVLPGYTEAVGIDVNALGDVLDSAWSDAGAMGSRWTDFDGDGEVDPGERPTFGSLGGGTTNGYGLNASGVVVGWSEIEANQESIAITWSAGTGLVALESLPGIWAQGLGINDAGVTVGKSRTEPLGPLAASRWHAVRWDSDGNVTDISPVSSSVHTAAIRINNNDVILGANTSSPQSLWVLMGDDPPLFLGGGNPKAATDLNDNNDVVGYVREGGSFWQASRWQWQGDVYTRIPLAGLPGFVNTYARGLNNTGTIVGTATDPDDRAVMWTGGEAVDLNDFLPEGSGWVLRSAWSVNDDGVIVGGGELDGGGLRAFVLRPIPPADTDGDGLPDVWETEGAGIDINCDGTIDLDLYALGARPDHKDLFVEVDLADGQFFHEGARNMVIEAFDNAPIDNPDGATGITLHIHVDEPGIVMSDVMVTNPVTKWPDEFDDVKSEHFGTVSERDHENAEYILAAKKRAFRYCLFAKQDDYPGSLGVAEIVGNDLILTLGALTGTPTEVDEAAIFMHELGHTLGLRHGGHDHINGKPNYISVMNYAFTRPVIYSKNTWFLDYSRIALPPLNELDLDESDGIQAPGGSYPPNLMMPYGVDIEGGRGIEYVSLDGTACDWNSDFDFDGDHVVQDINYLGPGAPIAGVKKPSFPETLEGHDDWANLHYAIGTSGDFADFVHTTQLAPEERITTTLYEWIDETFPPPPAPCVADLSGDRTVDAADLAVMLSEWGPCPACAADLDGDGDIGSADLAILLSAWGDCP